MWWRYAPNLNLLESPLLLLLPYLCSEIDSVCDSSSPLLIRSVRETKHKHTFTWLRYSVAHVVGGTAAKDCRLGGGGERGKCECEYQSDWCNKVPHRSAEQRHHRIAGACS